MPDTTPDARIPLACPACSPDLETVHEVIHRGGQATVRCTDCSHVHKTTIDTPDTVDLSVIVSQRGESFSATAEAPADESIAVGEEFLLETDEALMTVRITSLELADGRAQQCPAADVETVWTRAVGNVAVDATIHPKGGAHDETRSIVLQVPGDYEFVVGETDELSGESFTVEGIHLRDDATGYDFDKLDHAGDSAPAKDVNRLYARDETTTAWSPW